MAKTKVSPRTSPFKPPPAPPKPPTKPVYMDAAFSTVDVEDSDVPDSSYLADNILDDEGLGIAPAIPPEITPTPETPYTKEASNGVGATQEQFRQAGAAGGMKATKSGPPLSMPKPEYIQPCPDPKYRMFWSDHPNPNQRTRAFWTWWNQLPVVFQNRCMLYVYRDWPVLVQMPDERGPDDVSNIDKISGTEPIQGDTDFNDKYGAGDFHCFFNEQGKPHARTIATLYIKGSRDMKSRPPSDRRISDVNQVEMTDPQNRSYIEFLRMRGFLPEQQKGKEKEAEMAIAEAMKTMADQSGKTLDKFIGVLERKNESATPVAAAMQEAISVVSEGAKAGMAFMTDSMKAMQEESNRRERSRENESTGSGSGEGSVVDLALRLVKELRPQDGAAGTGASEEVRELRAALARRDEMYIQGQNERIAALETRLLAAAAPASSPASQFTSIKEGVEAIRQMRDLTEDLGGGGAKAEATEAIADAMPVWLKYLLPVIPVVVAALTGRAAAPVPEQMQPQLQPPPQPSTQPPPPQHFLPPGSAHVPSGGTGPIPINRAPANASLPTPAPALAPAAPSPFSPEAAALLHAIAVPLGNHLADRESSGSIFADWFIGGYGETDYQSVASLGPEMLTETLLAFPRTLAAIQGSGRTHAEVIAFVAEFCNPDFEDDGEAGEGGEEAAAKAKPGPVKVEAAPAPPPEPAPAA